jgi:hypothetical protein
MSDVEHTPLVDGKITFEPHRGYGSKDPDGNPWPFGYVSTETPTPIFELNVFLEYDRDELLALLKKMIVAVNAHDALVELAQNLITAITDDHSIGDTDRVTGGSSDAEWFVERARAALKLAGAP